MVLKGENKEQGPGAMARPPVSRCRGDSGSVDELYTAALFQNHPFCFWCYQSRTCQNSTHEFDSHDAAELRIKKAEKRRDGAGVMEVFQRGVIPAQSRNVSAWQQHPLEGSVGGQRLRDHGSTNVKVSSEDGEETSFQLT